MSDLIISANSGQLRVTGRGIKINGIDPTNILYVVRGFWDPEGVLYEIEDLETGNKFASPYVSEVFKSQLKANRIHDESNNYAWMNRE